MLLKNIDMMVTKVELKEGKEKNQYLMINLVDIESGDMFEIIHRDIEAIKELTPFTKVRVNLNLTSGKYGLSLKLHDIVGTI